MQRSNPLGLLVFSSGNDHARRERPSPDLRLQRDRPRMIGIQRHTLYADVVSSSDAAAERLWLTLELYEVGERMLRQRLRRERPHATSEEIDAEIGRWLRRRSGAEHGDYPGPRSARTP